MHKLFLASQSPRRQMMIRSLGFPYELVSLTVDESSVTDPDPAVDAVKTALLKATAAQASLQVDHGVVLGADTIVALDGQVLGKPDDADDARRMLRALRDRPHYVHTGIALIDLSTSRRITDVATVEVQMRPYSDAEIEAYIATGDPLDKAGAYGIQHAGFHPVAHLQGCYASVVGLPLCHVIRGLQALGVAVADELGDICGEPYTVACALCKRIFNLE